MRLFIYTIVLNCAFILGTSPARSQNLGLTVPVNFLPAARTDKAIDITNFKGGYFVTWKESGSIGSVNTCYLGKQYAASSLQNNDHKIGNQRSAFAPVLWIFNNYIYTFWIGLNGDLRYVVNNTDTTFNTDNIQVITLSGKLRTGITATVINDQIMIASHAANKNNMVVALLTPDKNGKLWAATLQTVPGGESKEYPFVVTLTNGAARLCYSDDTGIFYTDFDINTNVWTKPVAVSPSKTNAAPALYHGFNTTRLFYFWKGNKNSNSIFYTNGEENSSLTAAYPLPNYFKTAYPVSICRVDDKKFALAFVGPDQKFYLSYFTNYDPARWIEQTLLPDKGDLTLKDIVIPGSHDAGMSIITATAGMQKEAINACNTLTQLHNVGVQLKQGIRMFDLRIGMYKGQLHTKHSSADCVTEAMGGAYGEPLNNILDSLQNFLDKHPKEFALLTFSHFCPTEAPATAVADSIIRKLGTKYMYRNENKSISNIRLKDLAGKVIITFEDFASTDKLIDSNSMSERAETFLNFRRAYAATNQLDKLFSTELQFFTALKEGVRQNDLVRLDWQLTQSSEEAALVCNDFQSETIHPLLNGMMLLANVVAGNKSIRNLATVGNNYLPSKINTWIADGTINKLNKPNILYVDVAGSWITDYCVELNSRRLYAK